MTRRRAHSLALATLVLTLAAAFLLGRAVFAPDQPAGGTRPSATQQRPQPPPESRPAAEPSAQAVEDPATSALSSAAEEGTRHDLSEDEARGGHTLSRHVGRTDAQLRDRLRRERRIAAASSYLDRATAERVVGETLKREAARVKAWLARDGRRPNLALDYRGDPLKPIGRSIRQGEFLASACVNAVVVLRWDENRRVSYVLTSYPECRR